MKMFIATLLLVSSFAVSAKDLNLSEAQSFKAKLINIYNYKVELKCNAITNKGVDRSDNLGEFARNKVIDLAVENLSDMTFEVDNDNEFADYVTISATYDTNDNSKIDYLAKIHFIQNNTNIYKMELKIKKYKIQSKTKAIEVIQNALVTCVNEKI